MNVESGGSSDEADDSQDTQGSLKNFIVGDHTPEQEEENEGSDAGDEDDNERAREKEQRPNGRASWHSSQPEESEASLTTACVLGFAVKVTRREEIDVDTKFEEKNFYVKLVRPKQTGAGRLFFFERNENNDEDEDARLTDLFKESDT